MHDRRSRWRPGMIEADEMTRRRVTCGCLRTGLRFYGNYTPNFAVRACLRRSGPCRGRPVKPSAQPTQVRTLHLPPGEIPGHWCCSASVRASCASASLPIDSSRFASPIRDELSLVPKTAGRVAARSRRMVTASMMAARRVRIGRGWPGGWTDCSVTWRGRGGRRRVGWRRGRCALGTWRCLALVVVRSFRLSCSDRYVRIRIRSLRKFRALVCVWVIGV